MTAALLRPRLDKALEEWARELAEEKDPKLLDIPLRWMFLNGRIKGFLPGDCPDRQRAMRLTRWAGVLKLALQPPGGHWDIGTMRYVGEVQNWPIELSDVVDYAARNRAAFECPQASAGEKSA